MVKYWNRPEGLQQTCLQKCIFGFSLLFGLLALLVLPLLLFSTLFHFNSVKPVNNASLELSALFDGSAGSRAVVLFNTAFASHVQDVST